MAQATQTAGAVASVTDRSEPSDMRWPILASIIGPITWLSLTLLYVGFWAQGFTVFQSVIVILVSLLVLAGVMGGVWTVWGAKYRGRIESWSDHE